MWTTLNCSKLLIKPRCFYGDHHCRAWKLLHPIDMANYTFHSNRRELVVVLYGGLIGVAAALIIGCIKRWPSTPTTTYPAIIISENASHLNVSNQSLSAVALLAQSYGIFSLKTFNRQLEIFIKTHNAPPHPRKTINTTIVVTQPASFSYLISVGFTLRSIAAATKYA